MPSHINKTGMIAPITIHDARHPFHIPPCDEARGGGCAYCRLGAECMAHGSENGGECTSDDAKVMFRCEPDAGLHLCNKHGCKYLLARRAFNGAYKLVDGRRIPHIGTIRSNATKVAIPYSYIGKRAERIDKMMEMEGNSDEMMFLHEKYQPLYMRLSTILGN